jgi:CO dehydrogenase/acetyl-CoA synthase beta subunit
MRCAPTGTDTTMPSCAEWNAAALQNMYDAESLRRAVCCFRPIALAIPEMDGMGIVVNRMQQGPVAGGCVERWMTVQVELPGDCCPPPPLIG